jgi:predicted ATPase/DNA-binding SARP family transcriptional activator
MATLDVFLLGPPRIMRSGVPVPGLMRGNALTLAAYLFAEAGTPKSREWLALALWPDRSLEKALHSLRQTLLVLREALVDQPGRVPYLLATDDTIDIDLASDFWCDSRELLALFDACDQHQHRRIESCSSCVQRLTRAVALLRGDFCEQFSTRVGPELEDWVQRRRTETGERASRAFEAITRHYIARQAWGDARAATRRWLEIDPWSEIAVRWQMWMFWQSGDRPAALKQYDAFRQLLAGDLGIEPEDATVTLFEQIRGRTSLPRQEHAIPLADQRRAGNFPVQTTALIGREADLERIGDLLARPGCRLVTLYGPGGIGKTRIAMQAAQLEAPGNENGAWFVPLAAVVNRTEAISAIAGSLGIPAGTRGDRLMQLRAWLHERELLVVLDNVEHLPDIPELVSTLLTSAPRLSILATSRTRLRVQGEWVVEVQGLDVPEPGVAESLETFGAVHLLSDVMQRNGARLPFLADDYAHMVDICRMTEGLPLAIELAGAWYPGLSLPEIAANMRRSMDFLATGGQNVPERHRSIRAAFGQSWHLLTGDEQAVFVRLCVFRGGFTREAAESVADASLATLLVLLDKSFLRREGQDRYDIHELLRQYGEELLHGQGSGYDAAREAHGRYYLTLLGAQEPALQGHGQHAALARINADKENIRAAWGWAANRGEWRHIESCLHALWLYSALQGWPRESEAMFAAVVAAAQQDLATGGAGSRYAMASALVRQGGYRFVLGDQATAQDYLELGIASLRSLAKPRDLALGLNFLGAVMHLAEAIDHEEALLNESLDLFRTTADDWGCGHTLNDLGMIALERGDVLMAEHLCLESLTLFQKLGERRGLAFAFNNLGVIATRRGDFLQARILLQESLALRRANGDVWGTADALMHLGVSHRQRGDFRQSAICLTEALDIALEGALLPVALENLFEISVLYAESGQLERSNEISIAVLQHPAVNERVRAKTRELLRTQGSRAASVSEVPGISHAFDQLVHSILQSTPGDFAGNQQG